MNNESKEGLLLLLEIFGEIQKLLREVYPGTISLDDVRRAAGGRVADSIESHLGEFK